MPTEGVDTIKALEPATPADVGLDPDRINLARRMLHAHVAAGRSPSAAAIVARHGKVVLAEVAGVQRPDGPDLTLDHLWPLASASKPFTAAVLLGLVEEGRVGINEPIVEHFPELAGTENDDVLVHHLLTHTAGWESDIFTGRSLTFFASGELTDPPPGRDLLTHLLLTLAFDPIRVAATGEEMQYANINYELLAEIVRRVTGDTLDAAVKARILEPLEMTGTAAIVPADLSAGVVQRPVGLPFGPVTDPTREMSFEGPLFESSDSGALGLLATPGDLARFGQAILEGGALDGTRILAPATVAAMTANQIPGTPAKFGPSGVMNEGSWGYGFSVICEQRWPWFGGGLVPMGSVTHPGVGGVNYWVDLHNEIVGVFFEVTTEVSEMLEPISGMSHRFQDIITGAVVA
jgi:CubicO group peptidase (beta-lactamase class C family)